MSSNIDTPKAETLPAPSSIPEVGYSFVTISIKFLNSPMKMQICFLVEDELLTVDTLVNRNVLVNEITSEAVLNQVADIEVVLNQVN